VSGLDARVTPGRGCACGTTSTTSRFTAKDAAPNDATDADVHPTGAHAGFTDVRDVPG
jgi:hypothetical protein